MTTQTLTRFDIFERHYGDFQSAVASASPAWLRELREQALARFREVGFPTARRGNEPWKYTNVAPIARAEFGFQVDGRPDPDRIGAADIQRVVPLHEGWINLVFVNGTFSEALSSPTSGVTAMSLADAIASGERLVEEHLGRHAALDRNDGFVALNTAFVHDGAFIHVAEGQAVESPIHVVFVSTHKDAPFVAYPRILFVAEPNSKATLFESYVGLGDNRYLTSGVSEIVLGEGASLSHVRLLRESDSAFHVDVQRVYQAANTSFASSGFSKSAGIGRYDLYALLDGENANCEVKGLYSTSGTQHIDNYINIDHTKPHGTSRLTYKGILAGKSRAVFGGTVYVRPGAVKTDAQQTDKNLVLSPDAEVDSKPALFIYADDVKCGHGATAGNISEDTVFYMRSRGIDLEAASRMLIFGFASEIIDTVQDETFHDYLSHLFLDTLPTYKFEF